MQTENEERVSRVGVRELAIVIGLLVNFGGLVWGAATLSESVKNLRETVVALSTSMNNAVNTLNNQTAKTAVLEYRVSALEISNVTSSRK